jgi:hypothetical protein
VGRVLVIVAIVAITLLWFYILSGAPKRNSPDYLQDRAFVTRTAHRCADTRRAINKLPPADTSKTPEARAAVVDEATADLQKMVDDIGNDLPKDAKGQRIVKAWLADWDHYLANRTDYAERLRKDAQAKFYVDEKPGVGDSYDAVVKNFADTNNIPDCDPTLDVG